MEEILQQVNDHYTAIINKNIEKIVDKYCNSESTYVVLEGPRLTTIGYKKIEEGWRAFCNSAINLVSISWIEGPFVEQHETMGWVSGIIVLKISINENSFENTFRASFVLIKENQIFKIKHEHVSVVHPNPYGIGDWKK